MTRITGTELAPAIPVEISGHGLGLAAQGASFPHPGPWFGPVLLAMACMLAFGPARKKTSTAVLAAIFTTCLYLFVAMAAFASGAVFLPLVPGLSTMAAGLVAGRIGHESGWLGR